jgi:hypothetical protein
MSDISAVAADVVDASIEEQTGSTSVTDVGAAIVALNTPGAAFYSSITGTDFAAKKKVAAALTSSLPIDENLGKVIALVNVIVLPVELANDQGEVNTAPRCILLDADGTAYHATSVGMLSAIRNLLASLGEPSSWETPVDVKVIQQKGNNGYKYFTLNLV